MAEFVDVLRQFDRMCKANAGCFNCPLHKPDAVSDERSIGAFVNDSERIEREVMKWAAEHPEPVYPTWLEYLARYCGAPQKIDFSPIEFAEEVHGVLPETYIHWLMTHRIPPDTASKLGIEPKEGV